MFLNAENWTEAEKAVNNWAYEHGEIPTLEELGLYPARKILKSLERRHTPIRHCFVGRGPQLANLDAKIALNIVLHFINQGIPCLPVHDSFLVQERYESELRRGHAGYVQGVRQRVHDSRSKRRWICEIEFSL